MIGAAIAGAVAVPAGIMTIWALRDRCWDAVGGFGSIAVIFGLIALLQWNGY